MIFRGRHKKRIDLRASRSFTLHNHLNPVVKYVKHFLYKSISQIYSFIAEIARRFVQRKMCEYEKLEEEIRQLKEDISMENIARLL